MTRRKREGRQQKEKKGNVGGGQAETSLLSVTMLAFDVCGPSCVPIESLSSGPHSGAVEHRESLGEGCLSEAQAGRVDDWGCLRRCLTEWS